jgi:hypothetical protein
MIPVSVRLGATAPDGYITPSGASRLRERFLPVESAKVFSDWAELPVTRLVRETLQTLVISGPPGLSAADAAVQHGVTSGLSLALQLMTDPSIVYPELFTGVARTKPRGVPEPDYSTSAFEVKENNL